METLYLKFGKDKEKFVFFVRPPEAGAAETQKPKTAAEAKEAKSDELASLASDLRVQLIQDVNETIGEEKWEKVSLGDLAERWERLCDAWEGSWDRLVAIGAGIFGKRPSEIKDSMTDATRPDISQDSTDADIRIGPPPPDEPVEKEPGKATFSDRKRAESAERKLAEHPDWKAWIARSASRHEIPLSTLAVFIEMESAYNPNSLPTYRDRNGRTVRERWMPRQEREERGLTFITSAHGLAQAMQNSVPTYLANRYEQFRRENSGLQHLPDNPDEHEIMYNPEVAIDFMGWHLRRNINSANSCVRELQLPDKYLIKNTDEVAKMYMAYNQGPRGYAILMRYLENPTQENYDALKPWQKEDFARSGGGTIKGWERRKNYAERTERITRYFASLPSTIAWADSVRRASAAA